MLFTQDFLATDFGTFVDLQLCHSIHSWSLNPPCSCEPYRTANQKIFTRIDCQETHLEQFFPHFLLHTVCNNWNFMKCYNKPPLGHYALTHEMMASLKHNPFSSQVTMTWILCFITTKTLPLNNYAAHLWSRPLRLLEYCHYFFSLRHTSFWFFARSMCLFYSKLL